MIDPEDEELQALPPDTAEPIEVYTALAVRHGLIRLGDKLDDDMIELMADLVGLCANVGDGYGDPSGANAGDHIRAVLRPF
ncbi:MAG: hypothetical protein JWQ73_4168 [Variovorax sp.]|jgi:hypothetical protein|nr:hypothetical protein [Variovorax sp.]